MEKTELIAQIAQMIKARVTPEYKVILFGSWAKGNALPTSDIDIGILGKHKLPFETYVEIKNAVETIPTLRTIDVVDLQSVSAHFRETALQHTQTL